MHQASELSRQVLFLSENLNKIKVALALKQGLPAEVWKNVYRLVDQIKMNLREINFGVTRLFTCDALEVIRKKLTLFQAQVAFPIVITHSGMTDEPLLVCIKSAELTIILDNLLENAKQAMKDQPDPKIHFKINKTDQFLRLEISDNGQGIPRKLWDQIFDQNYTTKPDAKGGFGLYYSRRALEKYGGSVEVVKSSKNRGTTFLIKLKRA
jgi:C4-dicarboxylate-specific signal transduction histidine kinase